jgi:EAL domain-containing protein (putative c-di-GMP-specific phosphodiesterase class I)/ActR/RegA family two-component response regulator
MAHSVRVPRVLLVGSDAREAGEWANSFRARRLEVDIAGSLAEAVIRLREVQYSALVAEVALPDGSGIELARHIDELSPGTPIVLVTDAPTLEAAVHALEQGAARYLVRPIAADAVFNAAWSAIAKRERSHESQRRISLPPEERDLRLRLHNALENMFMVFQPIVSWEDRRTVAYEALVRTSEPSLARPDLFFGAAERLNMVVPMGRSIRAAVAKLMEDAPPDSSVFVNVHAAELADEELFSPDSPLSKVASRVVLEITERWSLDHFQDVRERIHILRELGFRVAVDDLGAGYAGLTSFARLRPEVVKLDMSLIRGVNEDPTRQHLIRSLNTVCRDLGIRVVAEGVETLAERDTLVSLGSDLLQGYLFSKPAPAFPEVDSRSWESGVVGPNDSVSIPVAGFAPTLNASDLSELKHALERFLAHLPAQSPSAGLSHEMSELSLLGQRVVRGLGRVLDAGDTSRVEAVVKAKPEPLKDVG